MTTQPDYDKLLEPIADVTTSIETLMEGAFGKLMGDQREGLKRAYAAAWGLHTLLLDIVTNIGIENIAKRVYLPKKFDEYISAIVTNAQNLIDGLDGPLTEEQLIAVEFIRITGVLLRRYVDNLWLYSQLANDLYHVDKQFTTLESILDPMKWSVTEKPVELELLIPEDAPPVRVDASLMQISVAQIVDNAIENTDEGNIRVSVELHDEQVVIIVSDTGTGFPSNHRKNIFTPFFQSDPQKPGLGLGLSIAQKGLLLHGGIVRIDSTQNGTTARLEFSR